MAVFGHFYRCFVLTVKVAENVHFYGWACSTIKVAENGLFYGRMEKHSRNSSQYLKLDFFNFDQSETPRIQIFSEKKENSPKKALICTVKTNQRKEWPKTATFIFENYDDFDIGARYIAQLQCELALFLENFLFFRRIFVFGVFLIDQN